MADVNLFKQYNINELHKIYYINGSNEWLKQECLNQIIKTVETIKPNVDYYRFNGKDADIRDIIDICESIPLGCDFKCIIIRDWELDKLDKKTIEHISKIFLELPDFCSVIIANINISIAKTKIKNFLDAIRNSGKIIEIPAQNQVDINNFIISNVRENNCNILNKNARILSQYCNNDLGKISQEIEKLVAFCQFREITEDDIKLLVVPTLEVKVFDLIKFINYKDKKKAYRLLIDLINNKEEPILILSVISMNFLDLYRAKVAKLEKKSVEDVLKIFDYKGKEFRINKAFVESDKYTMNQIKNIINLLIDADYKLKSSGLQDDLILEELLIKIFNVIEAKWNTKIKLKLNK